MINLALWIVSAFVVIVVLGGAFGLLTAMIGNMWPRSKKTVEQTGSHLYGSAWRPPHEP